MNSLSSIFKAILYLIFCCGLKGHGLAVIMLPHPSLSVCWALRRSELVHLAKSRRILVLPEHMLSWRNPAEINGLQVYRESSSVLCHSEGLSVTVNDILMFHFSSHVRFLKGIWHTFPFSWINWADLITK